ncbi:polymeric immunoglobulin receptor [Fukomys damarensis]|uniref:polymeric immunoglobulin receptor n=1 Tax=Fukomys damarensis TaxID=885580 RepID=UPI00053FFF62|nr:polymeric immunoglobulin receptor [Fukomys damarensis]
MMLSLLVSLLAIFPVVSTRSPIFGPKVVSAMEGSSVSITCYYPDTSVNRHTRKYWCRQGATGSCVTLISSEGYISKGYVGRSDLTNFPASSYFVVNITHVNREDSGHYKCGLGINTRGLNFDVGLEVSEDPRLLNDTEVYTGDVGGTVTISCPFSSENAQKKKLLCKEKDETCELIIDSNNAVNSDFDGRVRMVFPDTVQRLFSVVISQLRPSDTGVYVCQAGEDPSGDKTYVDLQVLKPQPVLVYGQLRGSVTFDCALGPEMANVHKFLCRVNKDKSCEVIINTLGKRDPAFEGRILLLPGDASDGRFSVLITGLRTGDEGQYLCGAHPDGVPTDGWHLQAWQLFINQETIIPQTPTVVKGVTGGSVAVRCPYNPKESESLKYWCRWEGEGNARCLLLVESQGLVQAEYEGRLALFEEPGNGSYTIILNQLTAKDAGFYWCLTNGDIRWRTTVELKVVDGEPSLKVPENTTAVLGETVKLDCHYPCRFKADIKYWCKWSDQGCPALPSQDESPGQAHTSCDPDSGLISLSLQSVTREDEGWYWCGVKEGETFGETAAVYLAVKEAARGSGVPNPANPQIANSAPEEEVVVPQGREVENKAIQNKAVLNPKLFSEERVVEDPGNQAGGSRASSSDSSSQGQSRTSKVLLSTLVPLGLVLLIGTVAVWVARARHRKNVDRLSIRSYRTDISMSDFENSRDLGGSDNVGASTVTQETELEGKVEAMANAESTVDTEEPKRAKRSSKEEADMAYSAFLIQSSNIAAQAQDGPTDA